LPVPSRSVISTTELIVEDYVYLLPAMAFSITLVLCTLLYILRFLLQLRRCRQQDDSQPRSKWSSRGFSRICLVAGLIVLERLLYRYANDFALGLELTVLKVLSYICTTDVRPRYHACTSSFPCDQLQLFQHTMSYQLSDSLPRLPHYSLTVPFQFRRSLWHFVLMHF
jgi:hypothetical protein